MTLIGPVRPHQSGKVVGPRRHDGIPSYVPIDWVVDTGAEITAVHRSIGRLFRYKSTGASASPTTGGRGIQIVQGISAEFSVTDPAGICTQILSPGRVGVKSNNSGSNILGMEQVANVG